MRHAFVWLLLPSWGGGGGPPPPAPRDRRLRGFCFQFLYSFLLPEFFSFMKHL
jgi:hypothetical protein